MNKVQLILKNPLVVTMPIIIMLLLLWQQYTHAESAISTPTSNILANGDMQNLDKSGFPIGWELSGKGQDVTSETAVSDRGFKLLKLDRESAPGVGTTLSSPRANTEQNKPYFYKGFYKSDLPFDLLLRTNNRDGTTKQDVVGHYTPSSEWTTVSHPFTSSSNAANVQFIYSFADKGSLQIGNNYIEPSPTDVEPTDVKSGLQNLIYNAGLISTDQTNPKTWEAVSNGDNHANFLVDTNDNKRYLQTKVDDFKNGEAKWRYQPIETQEGKRYRFAVTYRSNIPAEIVAEYTLTTGEHTVSSIKPLLPVSDWTTVDAQDIETPPNAKNVYVSVAQHKNGTVETKDYGLFDITKAGGSKWEKPYVSFTFDDGWASMIKNGIPTLDEAGYKGTFYIDPKSIDTRGFMSSDQVALLKQDGHELASHGYEHMDFTTLPADGIDYQMKRAYEYFTQVHDEKTVDFAAPYGNTDAQLNYYVRKYYRSLRGTEDGINTRQNFDAYDLKALYVGSKTPVSKIVSAINNARLHNGWLILIYHKIDTEGLSEDTTISPMQFQQQIDAVKKGGVTVLPVSAVLDEIDNK